MAGAMTVNSHPDSGSSFGGDLSPGDLVDGRYQIVAMVGEGGMGQVYLAEDKVLGHPTALKLLPSHVAERAGSLDRFLAEVRHSREVSHPNVARVHDIGTFEGRYFLTMEFVDGETLERLIRRIGTLPSEKAAQIALEICSALTEVHRKGILHRDLKPANVMIDGDGHVRLTDFGLAVVEEQGPGAGFGGTPAYMAPEDLRGTAPSAAGELFALGLVLIELYTGERVLKGQTLNELRREHELGAPERSLGVLEDRAPRVAAVLARCLAAEARERPGLEEVRKLFEAEREQRPFTAAQLGAAGAPNNLPRLGAALVGRTAELEVLEEALATNSLVTLAGPGGAGKTRLALEVGHRALEGAPGGIWIVDLCGLGDGASLAELVASVLGAQASGSGSTLEAVCAHLRMSPGLLILDNCEHILDDCAALVTEVLAGAPGIRILATSQEPMGLVEEQLIRLAPLEVPTAEGRPGLQEIERAAAVQLFVENAKLANPAFVLTGENAPSVAEICRRLDGIPLALKLAAARAGKMSLEEIAQRLDQRFRLLTGGRRGEPDRQRTLRGALDWSHDLLTEGERRVFRSLAVFAGSFTLAAAEEVIWKDDDDPWSALDDFTRLVDRSLVLLRHDPAGGVRYVFLESIRSYATVRMEESGAVSDLRRRHREFYAGLVPALVEAALKRGEKSDRRPLLEEMDNLRLVLEVQGSEDLEASFAMGSALAEYWYNSGFWREGRRHLADLLGADASHLDASLRRDLLYWAGRLAQALGEMDEAEGRLRELLQVSEECEDLVSRRLALSGLGNLAEYRAEYGLAEEFYTECLELSRQAEDQRGVATSMGNLGVVAQRRGDLSTARASFEAAGEHFGALGLQPQVSVSLNNLCVLSILEGDLETARELGGRSLEIRQLLGDASGVAGSRTNLATIELRGGRLQEAAGHAAAALKLNVELGSMYQVAGCLEVSGEILCEAGQPALSARLFARADQVRRGMGTPTSEEERKAREPQLRRLEELLGHEQVRVERELGETGELDSLVELTRERLAAVE
ncbi:protein kinase [bacterium]|nr:protein kinase [bacterium]